MQRKDSCELCEGNKIELLGEYGILKKNGGRLKFSNYICRNCGLVFMNPMPERADYDEIYKQYESARHGVTELDLDKGADKIKKSIKGESVFSFIKEYLGSQKKVLDIGCGFGQISCGLKNFGCDVSSVEPSELLSRKLAEISGIDVFCGDFDNFFSQNEKKFNVLVLHHVFEHFRDPKEKLEQFKKILLPGGVVYLEIPSVVSFKKPVDNFFDYCHPYSYSPKTFSDLISGKGFKIIKINKNKMHRLQLVIAPKESEYQEINEKMFLRGGYKETAGYIKKRRLIDWLKNIL
ncbi:MAG: class I SAM-dependent methyltransferase [Patescibacteria group bacterium]